MIYAVKLKCPSCTSKIEVEDGFFGKELNCPQCQTSIKVPKIVIPTGKLIVAPTESSMLKLQMQNMKRKMDEQATELLRLHQLMEDRAELQEVDKLKNELFDMKLELTQEKKTAKNQQTEINMLSEQLDLMQNELEEQRQE